MTQLEKITIRRAQLADAPALQVITYQALGYAHPLDCVEQRLRLIFQDNVEHILFVAVVSNQVIGFVHGQHYVPFYAEDAYNVLGLAVQSDYQGKGIGKSLMQALEAEASARGAALIRLNSGSERHAAHVFYEQIGYERIKTQVAFKKYLTKREKE